jgi:hypothetical protein
MCDLAQFHAKDYGKTVQYDLVMSAVTSFVWVMVRDQQFKGSLLYC